MKGDAKRLIRELQEAIDANGGDDVFVGFVSMDEGEKYGHAEFVATDMSSETVLGRPLVVITYN